MLGTNSNQWNNNVKMAQKNFRTEAILHHRILVIFIFCDASSFLIFLGHPYENNISPENNSKSYYLISPYKVYALLPYLFIML